MLRENDSFPYVCCIKRIDTYRMNSLRKFIDITSTGSIPCSCFLLAINYGLFVESNGKKMSVEKLALRAHIFVGLEFESPLLVVVPGLSLSQP
jgi:hypothetical protein